MKNRKSNYDPREIFIAAKRVRGNSRAAARHHLKLLFHFMAKRELTPETLTYEQMWQFDEQFEKSGFSLSYRDVVRHTCQQYLFWLHKKKLLKADPSLIFPRTNFIHLNKSYVQYDLPEDATNFLKWIRATRARGTSISYEQYLKRFYYFLDKNNVSIELLTRSDVIRFFQEQRTKKYAASTFNHIVCQIRVYLRWLCEHNKLKEDPDSLIRNQDYQRCTEFLPRPFEVDQDIEIQKRLSQSSDIYCQGLLLMRYTGIRIGELSHLPFHCFKNDIHGNASLKIPPRKLLKERMVPIELKTLELIRTIQKTSKGNWVALSNKEDPPYLLIDHNGRSPLSSRYQFTLEALTRDIPSDAPITPHRFRHTYATTMLSAGMNLLEIKELLGHRSILMTLRYAKVTQQSIRESYYQAIELIAKKNAHSNPMQTAEEQKHQRSTSLVDLIKELQRQTEPLPNHAKKPYAKIIKRIQSVKYDLDRLTIP